MRILKFGGTCLSGKDNLAKVRSVVSRTEEPVLVVSAFRGVTPSLDSIREMKDTEVHALITRLRHDHLSALSGVLGRLPEGVEEELDPLLTKLERLVYGVLYTEELTLRTRDLILSFGERMSVRCIAAYLSGCGMEAEAFDADDLGVITDDTFGNASIHLEETRGACLPVLEKACGSGVIPVVTGFVGRTADGYTTTMGRSGSDYTAGALGYALDADRIEIWKTVDGFMSVDPERVPEARVIPRLSYEEAAELAYFGAEVIHPRAVEPAKLRNIEIWVRNLNDPGATPSVISRSSRRTRGIVKSISFRDDVGIVKFYASGGGYRPGVLGALGTALGRYGVNVWSATTSQTCVALIIARRDVPRAERALRSLGSTVMERIESRKDVGLICIVGEGLGEKEGLAARVFRAVARKKVNVLLISAGASMVAFHFTLAEKDIDPALRAIHTEFFRDGGPRENG